MSENINRGKNNRRAPNHRRRMDKDTEQGINENRKNLSGARRNENYAKSGKQTRTHKKDFKKIKVEETIEDIAKDIARIEKEIDLEIKEIMALKLGL